MTSRRAALAAVLLAGVSVGWLDPWSKAREASQLYTAGKYDDAAGKYNEALTDQPDSPVLHFNLGDTAYKQGKFTDAVNAFQQVPTSDVDPARTARVAYNVGNAKYRLGAAAEASDPKAALGLYAEALVAYRRALGAAPDDVDAKFNHEFVEKKIVDLKKKLEEQQKQQQDQQQQKQDQKQQQDQQQKDQQQQQQGDQQKEEEKEKEKEEQQQAEQPKPAEKQDEAEKNPAEADAVGEGEKKDGEMTKQEATALLDSQRDQEVQPDEVVKRLQGAVVGEPAQDW